MENGEKNLPNPGSDEAIRMGCTCPIMDNAHGEGFPWPDGKGGMKTEFWINEECPIHSPSYKEKRGKE